MQSALERLHTPQFGVCEVCGADIAFIRLAGNPTLKRCPGCEH
jgi:RNA polymerase-binding transcription factor DksA